MRSDKINALISDLENENIEPLTDTAVGEDIVELRRAMDRIEFQISRRLGLFARRQGYVTFGFVSLIAWLRRACRLSPGVACQHAEVARNLPSLAETSTALAAGEIGFHHAAVIARSVTEIGAEAVVSEESTLLKAAQNLDPKYLSYVTRRLRYCADPDGTLADANDNHRLATSTSASPGRACSSSKGVSMPRVAPRCGPRSTASKKNGLLVTSEAGVSAAQMPWLSSPDSASTRAPCPTSPARSLTYQSPLRSRH